MTSRPRTLLKRALQTGLLTTSLAASAAFGHSRPTQAPIAPQPFTTLPVRKLPQPSITEQARRGMDITAAVTRNLTTGETRLLAQLFGNSVDLSQMRVVFHANDVNEQSDSALTLRIHDPRMLSSDYSSEENPFIFGNFISKATAIAQQQAGQAWNADDRRSGNLYELDGRAFSAYSRAQQRAIIEDYALRFLHPTRQSYWLHKVYGGDKSITDPYLIAAVEAAFPTATNARKGFERMILRGLTDGEKNIVRGIFGNQFNTDIVWVHLSPLAYTDVAGAVASASEVYFYGHNRSTDFSKEDTQKLSTFIHEMVHIWQFQTERRHTVVVNDIYKYTIEAGARYQDFNIEQQAAMMEDYFLYFTHPNKKTRWLSQSYSPTEIDQRMQYVIAAVEGFLPGARMLRDLQASHAERLHVTRGVDTQLAQHGAIFDTAPHTPHVPEPPQPEPQPETTEQQQVEPQTQSPAEPQPEAPQPPVPERLQLDVTLPALRSLRQPPPSL